MVGCIVTRDHIISGQGETVGAHYKGEKNMKVLQFGHTFTINRKDHMDSPKHEGGRTFDEFG